MKQVLVTGASGFLGQNLCAQLRQDKDLNVLRFTKDDSMKTLETYIQKADFIYHLAGVNRPENEEEFDQVNRGLTEKITALLKANNKVIPILITSSIQAELDNPYGKSKLAAEKILIKWAKESSNSILIYRLPNVFGKWSRPNYNSVVSTFCHNIANNLEIKINDPEATLKLVYVDDVINEFIKSMDGHKKPAADGFYYISRDFTIKLSELSNKLYEFKKSRNSLLIPDLENDFDKFLYATYTSYFDEKDFGYDLDMKHDERGWLTEFIKSKQFGQIFVSRTKPGIARGNHWHHTKIEKFLVIDGEAEINFRNLDTKKVITYKVSGKDLRVLDIPAGYVHSIKNVGKSDLLTIFWADEIFDKERPDTIYEQV